MKMKKIVARVEHTFIVPDSAEVFEMDLQDFPQTQVLRINGQLYTPDLSWMRYISSDLNKERYSTPILHGSSFESISEEEWDQFQDLCDYSWDMKAEPFEE